MNMESHVEKLAGVSVLVIGDAMLDHYVLGRFERISPEAPVPILDVDREFDRVGGAANAAANVVSLGGKAELVCLAGRDRSDERDPDAERLYAKCITLGFEPELLRFLPCTIRKSRMIARGQQLLRVDWDHHFGRSDEEREAALATGAPWEPLPLVPSAADARRVSIAAGLNTCDVVLVSDYAKGMVDPDLMDQLRESGKPVIVDPRPQHAGIYSDVCLVTPNRNEAIQMLGLSAQNVMPPEKLAAKLSAKLHCNVLLTLGGDGMLLHTLENESTALPAEDQEVFDPTGAGDTVAATIALGIGAGLPLADAARLANTAAGLVVRHIGTATIRPDELREALAARDTGEEQS